MIHHVLLAHVTPSRPFLVPSSLTAPVAAGLISLPLTYLPWKTRKATPQTRKAYLLYVKESGVARGLLSERKAQASSASKRTMTRGTTALPAGAGEVQDFMLG